MRCSTIRRFLTNYICLNSVLPKNYQENYIIELNTRVYVVRFTTLLSILNAFHLSLPCLVLINTHIYINSVFLAHFFNDTPFLYPIYHSNLKFSEILTSISIAYTALHIIHSHSQALSLFSSRFALR